jgi:hypothetical protein
MFTVLSPDIPSSACSVSSKTKITINPKSQPAPASRQYSSRPDPEPLHIRHHKLCPVAEHSNQHFQREHSGQHFSWTEWTGFGIVF